MAASISVKFKNSKLKAAGCYLGFGLPQQLHSDFPNSRISDLAFVDFLSAATVGRIVGVQFGEIYKRKEKAIYRECNILYFQLGSIKNI